jgi:hypothetical protein
MTVLAGRISKIPPPPEAAQQQSIQVASASGENIHNADCDIEGFYFKYR